MSHLVSALSPAPLLQQVNKEHHPLAPLWPDFKRHPALGPEASRKPQDFPLLDSYDLTLERAFAAAQLALQNDTLTRTDVQPPASKLGNEDASKQAHVSLSQQLAWRDRTDKSAPKTPSPEFDMPTTIPTKRKAISADLTQPGDDVKKPKLEWVDSSIQSPKAKPGRPRKIVEQKPRRSLPKLRKTRPVQAGIHIDIWCAIIENSALSFVFKIKDIAKKIRQLLVDKPNIWKTVRLSTYGPDHPDPPPGLNERQYADLLVGCGCQSKGCKDFKARKTYWAFQRRWCIPCMKKNVVMEAGCKSILNKYPDIQNCIPSVTFDGWGNYQCIGKYTEEKPSWLKDDSWSKTGFLRADLARIIREYEEAENGFSSSDETSVNARKLWIDERTKANNEHVKKLQSIENWMETYKVTVRKQKDTKKRQKSEFFIAKALTMNPPLEFDILKLTPCFRNAISTSAEASEKTWKFLEKKLQIQRGKAESLASLWDSLKEHAGQLPSGAEEYATIASERLGNTTDKQLLILALADEVLQDLITAPDAFKVADEDFVRIALSRVYTLFQATVEDDDDCDLLMDDARMVYVEKIQPIINNMRDESRKEAMSQLKCPGCGKREVDRGHDFLDLMDHIRHVHANRIGDFDYFHVSSAELPAAVSFPWCRLEWPRNLPILAAGQDPKGRWNLHARVSEHNSPPFLTDTQRALKIFDDRVAATSIGPSASDFVGNVMFAVSMLDENGLKDKFRTQIALEYALRKLQQAQDNPPDFHLFEELHFALLRDGIKGVFEGFRCKNCCETVSREGRTGYFARSAKSLEELSEHYQKEHCPNEWSQDMLALPTVQELWNELHLPSNKKAYLAFEELFPTRQESILDPQLRGAKNQASTND
ncbi:MAG: hypothetical protein Q9222_001657 [Ikaeria aurantiellina]